MLKWFSRILVRDIALEICGCEFLKLKFRQILLILRCHLNWANYLLMLIGFQCGKILSEKKRLMFSLCKKRIARFF